MVLGDVGRRYTFPLWSTSGTRLAAIASGPTAAGVVVFDLSAGDALDAGEPPPPDYWYLEPRFPVIYMDWVDDGSALLVLAADDRDGFRLLRLDADGYEELVTGAPLFWDQLPSGEAIVHVGGSGGARLLRVALDGSGVDEIDRPGAFRSPAVSPSGTYWAYGAIDGIGDRVVVVDTIDHVGASGGRVLGSVPRSLTTVASKSLLGHEGWAAFAWHPTDDVLAVIRPFVESPHAYGPLGAFDARSGTWQPWIDETVLAFWWSPDGRSLAYVATSTAPSGGRQATDPGGGAQRVSLQVQGSAPVLRLGLFDVDARATVWTTEITPTGLFLQQQLPFADQYERSHAAWSPDGRYFAFPTRVDGVDMVSVLDAQMQTLRPWVPGSMPVWPREAGGTEGR